MNPLRGEEDVDLAELIRFARRIGVSIHVRGPVEKPVVEFRDRYSRRVVGGIEVKRRIKRAMI